MNASFVSVFIASVLLVGTRLLVQIGRRRRDGGGKRPAWTKRALASYEDALLGFAVFAAAVFIAGNTGADANRVGVLSIVYVVSRALELASNLASIEYLRVLVLSLSWVAVAGLYVLSFVA